MGISGNRKNGKKWMKSEKTGRKNGIMEWKLVENSGELAKKEKEYIK